MEAMFGFRDKLNRIIIRLLLLLMIAAYSFSKDGKLGQAMCSKPVAG
jgi:hypothetical protein